MKLAAFFAMIFLAHASYANQVLRCSAPSGIGAIEAHFDQADLAAGDLGSVSLLKAGSTGFLSGTKATPKGAMVPMGSTTEKINGKEYVTNYYLIALNFALDASESNLVRYLNSPYLCMTSGPVSK